MPRVRFYTGLFLVSAATLMLQLIQTRILSVVTWYYLAFYTISLAMFGLTAGAVWVYLQGDRFTPEKLGDDLARHSCAFALSTAVCLATQLTLMPVAPNSLTALWTWVVLAALLALPFLYSGVVVSLCLTRSPYPVGQTYAVDLAGAAAGCLGVLWLLDWTDAPSAVLWVAVLAASGSAAFKARLQTGLVRWQKPLLCLLAAAAVGNSLTSHGLQPLSSKGTLESPGSFLLREWNSFSRVAVLPERYAAPQMWGPSPTLPKGLLIEQRALNIDGSAGTSAYRFSGDLHQAEFLKFDVSNMAYFLPKRRSAAVLGVGGGRDVLSAAVFGVETVTGIELNPIFTELLTERVGFRDFTNIHQLPGVELIADEGRSWLARSAENFDIIQMSLIDTWAATGAGAFTLSENNLYTVEAWQVFFKRLSPGGVFSVSRWYDPSEPAEVGRLLSLAVATALNNGEDPRRSIIVAAQGQIATLLLSRGAFSEQGISALSSAANRFKHRILLSPDKAPADDLLAAILRSTTKDQLLEYTSGLDFDLTPPTDDRPFFFNQLPLNRPGLAFKFALERLQRGTSGPGVRSGNLLATVTLLILFLVALAFVVGAIVIPLRPALLSAGRSLVWSGTGYFLLLGAGFMLVEISLLQRLSVFLGHPTYSLSVLLFTLILSTGAGSLLSERVQLGTARRFLAWSLISAAAISTAAFSLPLLFLALDGAGMLAKCLLCVAAVSPLGLLLGFGFPTGLRLTGAVDQSPGPWFWGINGAAGVLASVAAVVLSISFGIQCTLLLGAACYVLLIPPARVMFALRAQPAGTAN